MKEHEINDEGRVDWEAIIENCGLSVLEKPARSEVVDPVTTMLAVTGGNVRPAVSVRRDSAASMDSLDSQWQSYASPLLGSSAGEFLLILGGPGSIAEGWFHVYDPIGAHLPSRIASASGRPEFIGLSRDGARLCAVSIEDDEYWIVTHTFSSRE